MILAGGPPLRRDRGRTRCAAAAVVVLALASVRLAYSQPASPVEIDLRAAREHTRALAEDIGPRPADSAAARDAAAYIRRALDSIGVAHADHPVGAQHQPEIAVAGHVFLPARDAYFDDVNIVARIGAAATGDVAAPILLMGHYDTVYGSPGAVDNAVAVALLLELARALVASPPPRPIVIAFTAAEERRLAGARALTRTLPQTRPSTLDQPVGLAVSLDLIGVGGPLTANGLSALLGADWLRWLVGVADRAGVQLAMPPPHRVVSRHLPQIERSDHGVFTAVGVPAFHLYHRDSGVFLAYHTPRDTLAMVDPRAVEDTARFLVALVHTPGPLPDTGGDPGMWVPLPGGPIVVPALLVRAVELALLAAALVGVALGFRRRAKPGPWLADLGRGAAWVAGWLVAWAAAWALAAGAMALAAGAAEHPRPWVHAPGRHAIGAALLAVSALVLVVGAATLARGSGVRGQNRYLAAAVLALSAIGAAVLALGAHELAWLWLLPAAALSALVWIRHPWVAAPMGALGVAPVFALLDPALLREGVFNGFLPPGVPLAAVLAAVLAPYGLLAVYAIRRWLAPRASWPWRWRAAMFAAAIAIVLGIACLRIEPPACSGPSFRAAGLSCELLGKDITD